ncbi:hypothetical protein [Streptomyces sp. RKAG337]|uniref:hypothetical protein n=1 Tax=Streptomyces sp. RKAG337 TaxID=2893404 RepID=UPI002033EA7E|nr:hypothetical protein [Streptomyces sp. RKAG337]MCM2427698.1 hypothetical protein [Streptomyces sp. RKAG337]
MPLSIAAGITLDDRHLPHITMLQRYLLTAGLDQACAAVEKALDAIDAALLSYRVPLGNNGTDRTLLRSGLRRR